MKKLAKLLRDYTKSVDVELTEAELEHIKNKIFKRLQEDKQKEKRAREWNQRYD